MGSEDLNPHRQHWPPWQYSFLRLLVRARWLSTGQSGCSGWKAGNNQDWGIFSAFKIFNWKIQSWPLWLGRRNTSRSQPRVGCQGTKRSPACFKFIVKKLVQLGKNCSPWKKFAHLGRASISASRCSLFPSCRLLGFLDWKQVNFKDTMIKQKQKIIKPNLKKVGSIPPLLGAFSSFMLSLTWFAWQTTKDIFWPGKEPKIFFGLEKKQGYFFAWQKTKDIFWPG